MLTIINGKKTYLLCVATALWAVIGWGAGWLEPSIAQEMIWGSLVASGLRHGVSKT